MPPPRQDLLVVADHFVGGLGLAARAHATWFAERGWTVVLAAPGADSAVIEPAEAVPLAVPGGALDVRAMLSAARTLRRLVRDLRPAVIHAHGTRAQLLVLLAGRRPYVTLHGAGRVENQGAVSTVVRIAGRAIAPLLAREAWSVSPAGGRWQTLVHASPMIPRLDDLSPFDAAAVPTFVWIGRLDVPKQPDIFVRACAAAAEVRPVRGIVLGDGEMLADLRSSVAASGAPVEFMGETDDVPGFLAQAWGLCLFSGFEGVPFAVQEAMWARRAVVVSPLPTIRWFAGDAAVYAGDVSSATQALLQLCDPDTAARAGAHAGARVREMLSPEAPFSKLLSVYQRDPR